MKSRQRTASWTLAMSLLLAACGSPQPSDGDSAAADLPEEFRQLIPRGAIPAVFDPQFVSAEEADLDDEAWVLGVVIEGQPKAYSLNLLNHHEVVNDRSGETAFAAVW